MKITSEELQRRLNSNKNLANILSPKTDTSSKVEQVVDIIPPDVSIPQTIEIRSTKRSYTPGVSNNQRVLAGILASSGESSVKVARELGMTRNQVFHAARTSQEKIAGPREASLGRVQELALEKTMQALELMTEEKFCNASLKDLSTVAANMSRVIEKTTEHESETKVQLIIYAPEQKTEKSYNFLDV